MARHHQALDQKRIDLAFGRIKRLGKQFGPHVFVVEANQY
jgi:hypothetical protein